MLCRYSNQAMGACDSRRFLPGHPLADLWLDLLILRRRRGLAEGRSVWLVKEDTDNKNLPVGKELGSQSRQTLLVVGTDADQPHLKGDSVSTTKYLKNGITLE